ncbi:putative gustatory receptor 28b [Daphnia carinata]|uniref:putative gustatory receptor 28b n=1 Tax=Daphnia carinata TaxID=120202 RepID=UPI00257A109D|nr:putative gustatory receptor 28b [Daphnia carinata]
MSVFEQLQPFVSLCQACGLIPYTIERNSTTGKFERFTFSLRSAFTCWFCLVFAYQICGVSMVGYLSDDLQNILVADRTIPTTLIVLTMITSFLFLVQLLPFRWITMHYVRLSNAVEAVRNVERLLGEEFITEHRSSIPIRFVVGFFAVLMTSIAAMVVAMPMYAVLLPPTLGIFPTTALFVALVSINITFNCFLLFIHMCYYITAYYIQLVLLRCKEQGNDELQVTAHERTDKIKMMKRNALTFDYVCRASSELNSVFAIPVFFILAIKFFTIVSTSFAFAYSFIHTNIILENTALVHSFFIVAESIRVLILLTSADMPVRQVRLLHERVTAMSLSGFSKTIAEKMTMMTFLVQIDEDRVHLSAAGLFKIGVHLIPALSGAIVTYMVILLQN